MELHSTKETVPVKTVGIMLRGLSRVKGTMCLGNDDAFEFLNAAL